MAFWDDLDCHNDAIALIDGESGEVWSYRALAQAVDEGAKRLGFVQKKVIFLFAETDIGGILCYLSALRAGHAVYLGMTHADMSLGGNLICRYMPDIVLWKTPIGEALAGYHRRDRIFGYNAAYLGVPEREVADSLALLLSTSGTTGSTKLVRLSTENLEAGARQVAMALDIEPHDRAVTSLPISFVYGLSVLHSHLLRGASLLTTRRSILDRRFWHDFESHAVTCLAGVPWTYQTLRTIAFDTRPLPSLRKVTVSGGRLDDVTRRWLTGTFPERGIEVFLMYGQTEAGGRIAVLPPSLAREKSASVGYSVPEGRIDCDPDGQIVYRGPNVMLGYASCREDLQRGDDMGGVLDTGDIGYRDADGLLYLTGRASRTSKLLGLRINLDEMEAELGVGAQIAIWGDDSKIYVFVERPGQPDLPSRIAHFAERAGFPPHLIDLRPIAAIPRTANGKVQYGVLKDLFIEGPQNRACQDSTST